MLSDEKESKTHFLKLTAKATENRPKLPPKRNSSSNSTGIWFGSFAVGFR